MIETGSARKEITITRVRGGYLIRRWYDETPEIIISIHDVKSAVEEAFRNPNGLEVAP